MGPRRSGKASSMTKKDIIHPHKSSDPALRRYQQQLAEGNTLADVQTALCDVIQAAVGASGIMFFPLYRGASPDTDVVLHSALIDHETAARTAVTVFPKVERELGFISSFLRDKVRTRNVMQHYGREYLEKTWFYNEILVPCKTEQVVSAFMGSERPSALGYLCLTRSRTEPSFTDRDLQQTEIIRRSAEETLRRILGTNGQSSTSSQILNVLAAGLPHASAVLDPDGRLVWANQAAEQKLGEKVWHVSGHFLLFSKSQEVERWREAVREARALDVNPFKADRHITVNRIDRPGNPPQYLVVDTEVEVTELSALKMLSAREREIAKLAAQGFAPLNIGVLLSISTGTVRNHLKSIYKKLNVTSRVELAIRMSI